MTTNVGSAILIVGIGYLYEVYHLDPLLSVLGVALGFLSWGFTTLYDDRKRIIKAQVRYWEAKAINEEKKARQL